MDGWLVCCVCMTNQNQRLVFVGKEGRKKVLPSLGWKVSLPTFFPARARGSIAWSWFGTGYQSNRQVWFVAVKWTRCILRESSVEVLNQSFSPLRMDCDGEVQRGWMVEVANAVELSEPLAWLYLQADRLLVRGTALGVTIWNVGDFWASLLTNYLGS